MDALLVRLSGAFAVRAVAAALCGIVILARQDVSLLELAHLYGVYAMVDGLLALTSAVYTYDGGNVWGDPAWDGAPWYAIDERWQPIAVEGVLSFIAGVVFLMWPGDGVHLLPAGIAARFLATAVTQTQTAGRFQDVSVAGAMFLSAGVSAAGLALILPPVAGAIDRASVIGGATLIEAVLQATIAAALHRRWRLFMGSRFEATLAIDRVPSISATKISL